MIAPKTDQTNYHHFVMDIAWFGLALAATSRFLSVYAIRLGASPVDLGWISSLPALMVIFSSAFGVWWNKRSGDPVKALFWPGLGMRLLFLLPAFAPLVPVHWRPLWLILSVTIPALPQGVASVAFLIAMREGITDERLTSLVSRRSLALNISVGAGALAFGLLLENIPFPLNYQIMFLAAFAFALVSLWHCVHVRVTREPNSQPTPVVIGVPPKRGASPWRSRGFQQVALMGVVIHIAFFTLVPITPLYLVNRLGADEGFMALYGMIELTAGAIASVFAARIARRMGMRPMVALAMAGTAISTLIIALSPTLYLTLIAAVFSGACWTAAAGVGLVSFLFENTPASEAGSYSTAFNQIINLAVFIGPMLGSVLANSGVDLLTVILFGTVLRLVAVPLVDYSLLRRRKLRHLRRAMSHAS